VVTGTNSTRFAGSLKIVMAMARQTLDVEACPSGPALSGTPKPGFEGPCTPQRSVPRCLIWSRSRPAMASDTPNDTNAAAAAASIDHFIFCFPVTPRDRSGPRFRPGTWLEVHLIARL
jgi:hypothetical protein